MSEADQPDTTDDIVDFMPELNVAEWAIILAALRHADREFASLGESGVAALLSKLEGALANA